MTWLDDLRRDPDGTWRRMVAGMYRPVAERVTVFGRAIAVRETVRGKEVVVRLPFLADEFAILRRDFPVDADVLVLVAPRSERVVRSFRVRPYRSGYIVSVSAEEGGKGNGADVR